MLHGTITPFVLGACPAEPGTQRSVPRVRARGCGVGLGGGVRSAVERVHRAVRDAPPPARDPERPQAWTRSQRDAGRDVRAPSRPNANTQCQFAHAHYGHLWRAQGTWPLRPCALSPLSQLPDMAHGGQPERPAREGTHSRHTGHSSRSDTGIPLTPRVNVESSWDVQESPLL